MVNDSKQMKIALVQSALIWGDVAANLKNFDEQCKACQGCDVILLPEMFASGCMMVKKAPEMAMAEKEKVAACYPAVEKAMCSWARRGDALVVGSTACRENGKYYNRLIAALPDGTCFYYDKRHCFRGGGENEHFVAGDRQLVIPFRGVRMAFFICYDLRFPVWCRNTQSYDVAVFVANWPESRREIWKVLLKARAIENQAYVAGVNCVGMDNNGLSCAGDSTVVDARGREVATLEPGQEGIIQTELDFVALEQFREKFPVLSDRDRFSFTE